MKQCAKRGFQKFQINFMGRGSERNGTCFERYSFSDGALWDDLGVLLHLQILLEWSEAV